MLKIGYRPRLQLLIQGVLGIWLCHDDASDIYGTTQTARYPDQLFEGELLAGTYAKTAFEKDGLSQELKKAAGRRVLNAEMDHRLNASDGSAPERRQADGGTNSRNGYDKNPGLRG